MPDKKFLDLTLGDIIKLLAYGGCLLIFLIKTDARIVTLESGVQKLTVISEYLVNQGQANDNFHSSIYGVTFEAGKPQGQISIDKRQLLNELRNDFKQKTI